MAAGALGIQLGGSASYFGRLQEKPLIGEARRPIEAEDILRVHGLLYGTTGLMLVFILIIRGLLYVWL